jgi:hypothetical protein
VGKETDVVRAQSFKVTQTGRKSATGHAPGRDDWFGGVLVRKRMYVDRKLVHAQCLISSGRDASCFFASSAKMLAKVVCVSESRILNSLPTDWVRVTSGTG